MEVSTSKLEDMEFICMYLHQVLLMYSDHSYWLVTLEIQMEKDG
jgi:hypothetical protein